MNIYVSNLSFSITDEDLRGAFKAYGDVTSAKVIIDKFSNRSKGFGFVEMPNDEAAQKAIKELNNSQMHNRAISVSLARPKEDKPSGNKRSFSNNSKW
jgi:RNA recognition motif-containing protein